MDYSYGAAYADWQAELRASVRRPAERGEEQLRTPRRPKVVRAGRLYGVSRLRMDHLLAGGGGEVAAGTFRR